MESAIRPAIISKYVLQPWVLAIIKKPRHRPRIFSALGVTDWTIQDYIKKNSDNLTKAASMEQIRLITGKNDDKDLLMINPDWQKDNEMRGVLFQ